MLGQGIERFTHGNHYEEGLGKNLPFSVKTKWQLLIMATVYFGSGFAASFFIGKHQLLKK
ncbi:cytochrome c oxidase subunit 7C, mitochondrial-like [Ursus americanus]|uniref:Cytochrome c oxidase subunit 7C, mitochondrial n=2 Tax=Ursus TaxID=9639 RepID=A0A452TBE5_URSMA|nr:cytochrome c oxidase subunit 7C, mitochondrial-like [Ursus maritimus]XP_045655217.1 cytochrome c oxidase subunit 7C, mitochondrial-like [Ursus americanus]